LEWFGELSSVYPRVLYCSHGGITKGVTHAIVRDESRLALLNKHVPPSTTPNAAAAATAAPLNGSANTAPSTPTTPIPPPILSSASVAPAPTNAPSTSTPPSDEDISNEAQKRMYDIDHCEFVPMIITRSRLAPPPKPEKRPTRCC
jgi:hypothetical protein